MVLIVKAKYTFLERRSIFNTTEYLFFNLDPNWKVFIYKIWYLEVTIENIKSRRRVSHSYWIASPCIIKYELLSRNLITNSNKQYLRDRHLPICVTGKWETSNEIHPFLNKQFLPMAQKPNEIQVFSDASECVF